MPPLPPKRGLPLSARIRLILGTVLVLGLAAGILLRIRLGDQVGQQLQGIAAQGLPASGQELNSWYREVPEKENAAVRCEQAFTKLRAYPPGATNLAMLILPTGMDPLTPERRKDLRASVEVNKEALDLTTDLHLYPKSRYPVDLGSGSGTLLPHLSKLNHLANLRKVEAFLAADAGDAKLAASAILHQLDLARTLRSEPLVISYLVRIRINGMAVESLQRVAAFVDLPETELVVLAARFTEAEDLSHLSNALIGERAINVPSFRLSLEEMQKLSNAEGGEASVRLSEKPAGPMYYLGFFERDLSYYLGVMQTNIAVAQLGVPERLKTFPSMDAAASLAKDKFYTMSSMLLPALDNAVAKDGLWIADLRMAQVVIAVERFRRANAERLPDRLDQLVPGFLPAVPSDPFDGRPLRYRAEPDGYIVYSIGRDFKDDGGIPSPRNGVSVKPGTPADRVLSIKTRSKP